MGRPVNFEVGGSVPDGQNRFGRGFPQADSGAVMKHFWMMAAVGALCAFAVQAWAAPETQLFELVATKHHHLRGAQAAEQTGKSHKHAKGTKSSKSSGKTSKSKRAHRGGKSRHEEAVRSRHGGSLRSRRAEAARPHHEAGARSRRHTVV